MYYRRCFEDQDRVEDTTNTHNDSFNMLNFNLDKIKSSESSFEQEPVISDVLQFPMAFDMTAVVPTETKSMTKQ